MPPVGFEPTISAPVTTGFILHKHVPEWLLSLPVFHNKGLKRPESHCIVAWTLLFHVCTSKAEAPVVSLWTPHNRYQVDLWRYMIIEFSTSLRDGNTSVLHADRGTPQRPQFAGVTTRLPAGRTRLWELGPLRTSFDPTCFHMKRRKERYNTL